MLDLADCNHQNVHAFHCGKSLHLSCLTGADMSAPYFMTVMFLVTKLAVCLLLKQPEVFVLSELFSEKLSRLASCMLNEQLDSTPKITMSVLKNEVLDYSTDDCLFLIFICQLSQ